MQGAPTRPAFPLTTIECSSRSAWRTSHAVRGIGVLRADWQGNRGAVVGIPRWLTACPRCGVALAFALASALLGNAPAIAQDQGTIEGVVVDSKTGDPIIEAGIEVIGQPKKVKTDLDGKYTITLPPGTYELRIFAPLYQGTRLEKVVVTAGQVTHAPANLKPQGEAAVETVEVVAEAKKAAEATQILQRQKAAVVSDNISAQQIAKSPDTKASEVVQRVPAVTIQDNKYMFVRGLGPRYSGALLDGSRLPSTDPNKRVIPLDLFPADFIDSLNLIKTYTPDLPGDFAGGLLDITLREYPAQFTYSLGFQTSFNTATTFQTYDTYHTSCPTADYFGFGANCRNLPSIFGNAPSSATLTPTTPQMQRLVGSLPINWNIDQAEAPPNYSFTGSVGNSWGPFGFNLAAIYKTKYEVFRDAAFNSYGSIGTFKDPTGGNLFTYDQSNFETQLGAILTTGYELSPNHKLIGNALVNRHSVDTVFDGSGVTEQSPDFGTLSTSQQYTGDQLGFGQLGGRDHWDLLDLDWRAAWAPTSEDTPDNKFLQFLESSQPPQVSSIFNPVRTFGTMHEFLQDYKVDVTVPFTAQLPFTDAWSDHTAKFKAGPAYSFRDRTFDYRLFTIQANATDTPLIPPPDSLFIPPNFGTAPPFPLRFRETTLPRDSFEASEQIAGGYGMFDLHLIPDRLRFVGGVRAEYSYIAVNGADFAEMPIHTRLNNLDPLPGVNLIYTPRSDMNVRYSVSETVSRPEFRELDPTLFIVAVGQRSFLGNPHLVEAHIVNNDLRWEWFFSPLELVSASFFYKNFDKPIEIVAVSATSSLIDTPNNASSATLWGFEFEGRKNFGFLTDYANRWDWLKPVAPELYNVQFQSNISVIQSNVTGLTSPPPFQGQVITNTSRPLTGQPNYVINASLEYQNATWGVWRLLYNRVGPYIVAAGVDKLPDIEQQPRNELDAVWLAPFTVHDTPLTGKIAVENILNDRYLQLQGDRVTNLYLAGATFYVGVQYSF